MIVGERIKKIRKEKHISQKALGEKLGVSAAMIGQYETGVRNPKLETLEKIASALEVPVWELMGIEPVKTREGKGLVFQIPGKVMGKGRPRFYQSGGFTRAYTPKETENYENLVRYAFLEAGGNYTEEAVHMEIAAYFEIPKSVSKTMREKMVSGQVLPTKKPDADNIAKIVCDALNKTAYRDDTQVVSLRVWKRYTEGGPYVEVSIYAAAGEGRGMGNDRPGI